MAPSPPANTSRSTRSKCVASLPSRSGRSGRGCGLQRTCRRAAVAAPTKVALPRPCARRGPPDHRPSETVELQPGSRRRRGGNLTNRQPFAYDGELGVAASDRHLRDHAAAGAAVTEDCGRRRRLRPLVEVPLAAVTWLVASRYLHNSRVVTGRDGLQQAQASEASHRHRVIEHLPPFNYPSSPFGWFGTGSRAVPGSDLLRQFGLEGVIANDSGRVDPNHGRSASRHPARPAPASP